MDGDRRDRRGDRGRGRVGHRDGRSPAESLRRTGVVPARRRRPSRADPVRRQGDPLGETHLLPNGVALSVHDVGFGETYTYESSGGEKTAEPTDGDKWAVGTVRAENTADEPARAPLVSDIGFFRGEEEYSFQHLSDNRDRYRGGELEPGSVSEGDLPANVPVAAERAALRVEYSESFEEGQITVNWTLGE
ncbi:hypothetical protein ACFQL4_17870 [Halosimplex aquaticum]